MLLNKPYITRQPPMYKITDELIPQDLLRKLYVASQDRVCGCCIFQ